MRLKTVFISNYKNLKNFTLNFDGESFIDVFVGKNGSGKSNLFEALIEIFRHLDQFGRPDNRIAFDYCVSYVIESQVTEIEWKAEKLRINQDENRKTLGQTPFPNNVVIYYSGHNKTVAELVKRYEKSFRRRIYRGIKPSDFRLFIGIGPEYKALLLALLLVQPENSKAKEYIKARLGIVSVGTELRIDLQQPFNAKARLKVFDADEFDPLRYETRYWGADKTTQEFIDKLVNCIKVKDGFNIAELYDRKQRRYQLNVNLDLFQKQFNGVAVMDIFRQFDSLKTLGMLADVALPLKLTSGLDASIAHFSDGQFQSVYIYSIVELFKDRHCLTLLDEPDAFLHPEWQYKFLQQVSKITDATARRNNHLLMTSHSAVTLIPHEKKKIKFFDIKQNQAICYDLRKDIAINKLSADLIRYSERDTLLSILNTVQIERKPILFTEGSTDPIILKEAWYRLYEDEMPFIPFYAFSCTYINQLLTDNRIHGEMNGLPVFALFDFDKAYDQWNSLKGEEK